MSSMTARWASRASSPMSATGSAASSGARASGRALLQRRGKHCRSRSSTQPRQAKQTSACAAAHPRGLRRHRSPTRARRSCRPSSTNLKAAMAGQPVAEAFVPAIAPSNIEATIPNEHYPTVEAYLFALADAMAEEYRAIVDAGFLLQIDDPFLVTYYITRPDLEPRGVPQVVRTAGRGAQPRAQGHSGRANPLPHLLQHQHGSAHP